MKVLMLGDYIARTGFGTVSKNIVKHLKKHFGSDLQLDIVAINYFGDPFYEDENTYVISAKLNDPKEDDFGRYFFLKCLDQGNYDGIFICQDIGTIISIVDVLEHIKNKKKENGQRVFKSIFYFPIDSSIVINLLKGIEFFDIIATYTEYAREEILKLRPELKTKIKVIPHGNNSSDFNRLPDEDIIQFRKEYFKENADKFIITNVSRNQPRKDIPSTIFGFIEARKIWNDSQVKLPEPFLYLHMHPKDPLGWDIRGIMLQTDLVENKDYKLLPKEYEDTMVETEIVNKIYNASDVIITTTLGEGWGLTFSEAAACGTPIIAPYSTSFMEMSAYGKNAFVLKNFYPVCNIVDNVIREQTDIYEIADVLVDVASKKMTGSDEVKEKVRRNKEWAEKLEWSEVCKRWFEYFKIFK